MADRVATHVFLNSAKQYGVHLTCVSDGTGENDVLKVDKSTLTAADNAEPDALELEFVTAQVNGFTNVIIETDHTADDLILALGPGSICHDFTLAGMIKDFSSAGGLLDPRSTGGTGDIFLTSTGASSGATYDIALLFRKNTA